MDMNAEQNPVVAPARGATGTTTGKDAPVEAALDAALIVLRNGGSTSMAERAFRNVLKGYRQDGVVAAWHLDFVAASAVSEGRPVTVLKSVGPIGVHLLRTSETMVLAERMARGEIDSATFTSGIARIQATAPLYNRWILTATAACTAAVFSQLIGGDWRVLGIAFVAAGVGQVVRLHLQARKFSVASVTLVSGLISACAAGAGLRLGLSKMAASALIASVIYLAPGLPLINGFLDVTSHRFLLIGLERIANAAYLFLILSVAIAFADVFVV